MTEKQAESEIRYRLAKLLLFRLQKEGILTPEELKKVRQALCKKYKPFTYSLEVDEPWMSGKQSGSITLRQSRLRICSTTASRHSDNDPLAN